MIEGHILFAAVLAQAPRRFRRQAEQGLDGAARLTPRAQFEDLPQEDKRRNDRSSLKVHSHCTTVRAEGSWEKARHECRNHAVEVGSPGANRNECEHVQAAIDDGGPSARKEWPATPEYDWGRQDQLHPGEEMHREGMLHWLAWEHLGHRQQQERHRQAQTDPEPAGHVDQFGIRLLFQTHALWFEGHPTDGASTWLRSDNLRVHGTDIRCPRAWDGRHHGFKGHAAAGTGPWPLLAHFRMHGAGVHRPSHRCTPVGIVGWRHILRRISAKLLQTVGAAESVRYAIVDLCS